MVRLKDQQVLVLLFWVVMALLVHMSFYSCSSQKVEGSTQAEILYNEAERLVSKKRYILAIEKLNELKSQHPYSYYAVPAELKLADIYFLQKNYIEATGAYLLFRDMHPRHEKTDYVIYKIAQSYYKQLPSTHDRDLSVGVQAIKHYEELMRLYPQTEYADNAKEEFAKIQKMLAAKERYIADYYYKVKNFEAAKHRYLAIISDFSNTELLEHAKLRLIQSARRGDFFSECLTYIREFAPSLPKELARLQSLTDQCEEGLQESLAQPAENS